MAAIHQIYYSLQIMHYDSLKEKNLTLKSNANIDTMAVIFKIYTFNFIKVANGITRRIARCIFM